MKLFNANQSSLRINRKEGLFLGALFSLLLILLYNLKDILILLGSKWPHLYPVSNVSSLVFEEVNVYLSFLNYSGFSELISNISANIPLVTLMSQWIILKWICLYNLDLYLFLSHSLLPLGAFWLLYLIFRKYVSASWALLLAFFGVTFYHNFSSLSYVFNCIFNPVDLVATASLVPMEMTRTPFPSFSFFFFILTFYLSIRTYKLNSKHYLFLSSLWALNLYIYPYNFIAGMLFWLPYLIFTRYISNRKFKTKPILKVLLLNAIIVFIIVLPYLTQTFFFLSDIDKTAMQNLTFISKDSGLVLSDWGFVLSYLFPIVLMLLVTVIYCADYYELFYRFSPVFIMIVVELVVLNLHLIFGKFVQTSLFSVRIGNFFSRYLYYLPFIYFFAAPLKHFAHDRKKYKIIKAIHTFLNKYIIESRHIIATLGILILGFVTVMSSYKNYTCYEQSAAQRMASVEAKLSAIVAISNQEDTIVSDDIAVNLLANITAENKSLLINSFNTYRSSEEIIERLILFCKIFNWDEEALLDFMLPDETFGSFYKDNNLVIYDQDLRKGFGYWLVWHRREMLPEEMSSYKKKIMGKFVEIDLVDGLGKYNVKLVQAEGEVNPKLPVKSMITKDKVRIYLIGD